jgi:hypothetical protein
MRYTEAQREGPNIVDVRAFTLGQGLVQHLICGSLFETTAPMEIERGQWRDKLEVANART